MQTRWFLFLSSLSKLKSFSVEARFQPGGQRGGSADAVPAPRSAVKLARAAAIAAVAIFRIIVLLRQNIRYERWRRVKPSCGYSRAYGPPLAVSPLLPNTDVE